MRITEKATKVAFLCYNYFYEYMNISFVSKSKNVLNRHMLEHLILYRTQNHPTNISFYNYLYSGGVIQDFHTSYDYTEATFYNVTENLKKEIESEFNTYYFTEDDFNLEKRVILIECEHYEIEKVKIESDLLFEKYENTCDIDALKKIEYKDLLNLKHDYIFEKIEFSDSRKIDNFDFKDTLEGINRMSEKFINENSSFRFDMNPLLFELSDILHKCIYLSELRDKVSVSRIFTSEENTVILYGLGNKVECKIILDCVESNFQEAYKLFSNKKAENSVAYEIFNHANLNEELNKDEILVALKKFVSEILK